MIPGSNLLKTASKIIGFQTVQYYRFLSRSQNVIGQDVTIYAEPVEIKGSWQPVSRKLYEQLGLNFNRFYVTFYTSEDVSDVQRGESGDQIEYNGERYQVESENEWTPIDGWTGLTLVRIQDA